MVHKAFKATTAIDYISNKLGFLFSFLVIYLTVTVSFEVFMRYVFNRPTTWVWPLCGQVFGVYGLVAGLFAMYRNNHIRIDLLFTIFPPWLKAFTRIITFASIVIFLFVEIWQSAIMSWSSFLMRESDSSTFATPVYPLKLLIPIVAALFLLQSIADFFRRKF